MNLFQSLRDRFKAQNQERKAEERKTVAKAEMPKPYVKSFVLAVPSGHVVPEGTIEQPFNLIGEAGVRWHPEWEEPRITVNLWRMLPQGDALGWAGAKALDFKTLLDPDVVALVPYHGQAVTPTSQALLDRMGLATPKVQQLLSTFNTFRHMHGRGCTR